MKSVFFLLEKSFFFRTSLVPTHAARHFRLLLKNSQRAVRSSVVVTAWRVVNAAAPCSWFSLPHVPPFDILSPLPFSSLRTNTAMPHQRLCVGFLPAWSNLSFARYKGPVRARPIERTGRVPPVGFFFSMHTSSPQRGRARIRPC